MNTRATLWQSWLMFSRRNLTRALITASATATIAMSSTTVAAAPAPATNYQGRFVGAGEYTGSGTATTRKRTLRLASNFRADRRSIRLRMYLATDRTGNTFIDLGPMAESGAQTFRIPAGVRLKKFDVAIAWCAAVDEPIALAKLVAKT